jgi:hypothetical protein
MPHCRRFAILCGTLALLTACAAGSGAVDQSPAAAPHLNQYIDEHSGVTVATSDKPLLFARDRAERRAKLRDYVTMTAATVDRTGQRGCLLIAYIWSTLDARYEPSRPVPDALILQADDREIRLDAKGGELAAFGVTRAVGAPSGRTVKTLVLPTDLETLRFIGAARSLQVQATVGDEVTSYKLWDDQRKTLERFVQLLNGEC